MSRNQRLSFLVVAAVIAVAAVVVLGAGGSGDDSTGGATTAAEPTATPPAQGTASPSPVAGAPPATRPKAEPQVPVLTAGQVKRLRFTEGDTIRFQVRHDAPEEVHVHGYDLKKDVRPGKPAVFSFKAGITGIFEVELEQSGTQLAELRVEPG